jgi:glycosyltransferase involved in cell wall biosynthesis
MGTSDRVIAVSEAVARSSIAAGVPRRKVVVVHNGVVGSPRLDRVLGDVPVLRRPSILSVGYLCPRKGQADVVAALAALAARRAPEAHLYLVGSGPDRDALAAQAAAAHLDERVHMVGFQANARDWMRAADIVVLASRREPFGLALLEAREAGCAVLGTDVDGIPEVLEHGTAGILFAPGDVLGLSQHLERLLTFPNELQRQQAAARRGIERWTTADMAAKTLKVYDDLLRGHR